MHRSALAVALLTAGLTCACAGPKFYTLENGKEHETGIPIYPTKIFLVVSYTNAKDHPVEVTLVYDRGSHCDAALSLFEAGELHFVCGLQANRYRERLELAEPPWVRWRLS